MNSYFNRHCWQSATLVVLLGLVLKIQPAVVLASSLLPSDKQIGNIVETYGADAANRIQQWRDLIQDNKNKTRSEKLELVNRFFNQMDFVDDADHWGKIDYWATPVEFLSTQAGDCEDFAIAKYFTLRELGVPVDSMRLTYVKALTINQAHMVLAYYKTPSAEPVILDNIDKNIKQASKRKDLIPVYSFNGDNLWYSKELRGRGKLVGDSDRISLWRKLIKRMKQN